MYNLNIPFLNDNVDFAKGVRYGMLYMQLQHTKKSKIITQITEEEEENVRLMAHNLGWTVAKRRVYNEWVTLMLKPVSGV